MLFGPALVLVIFSLILVWLGWLHGDTSSEEEFNMAGRGVRWVKIAFGAFTVVGAGEIIGMTTYAYSVGFYTFLLTLGFAFGSAMLALWGPSLYKEGLEHKYNSLPDVVAARFGNAASFLTTIVNVVGLGALLLIQFALGGLTLSALINLQYEVAVFLVALVVVSYVWLGGFKAILFPELSDSAFEQCG